MTFKCEYLQTVYLETLLCRHRLHGAPSISRQTEVVKWDQALTPLTGDSSLHFRTRHIQRDNPADREQVTPQQYRSRDKLFYFQYNPKGLMITPQQEIKPRHLSKLSPELFFLHLCQALYSWGPGDHTWVNRDISHEIRQHTFVRRIQVDICQRQKMKSRSVK